MLEVSKFLDGIKWYLDVRKVALDKITSFHPPAVGFELRVYHSLYFSNLLAAIDFLRDDVNFSSAIHKNKFVSLIEDSLSTPNYPVGKSNYNYLRELRNSFIHRGLDITASAHVVDGKICVLSPRHVHNQKENIQYSAFGKYLCNIIYVCESKMMPAIFDILRDRGYLNHELHSTDIGDLVDFLREAPDVPEFVKAAFPSLMTSVDIERVNLDSYRKFLNSITPASDPDLAKMHFSTITEL